METLASVALLGQAVPLPLGAAGATCAGLQGAACPVRRGELLRYRLRIYVEQYLLVVGDTHLFYYNPTRTCYVRVY